MPDKKEYVPVYQQAGRINFLMEIIIAPEPIIWQRVQRRTLPVVRDKPTEGEIK